MKLTAIIPRLPPVVDGIGDYALSLARLLRDNIGITTDFIVTDSAWRFSGDIEGFRVIQLASHSAGELFEVLSAEYVRQVMLHYEGYGYASRGCPSWLVEALERWRRSSDRLSLVTMFHELYASGPPWTSSFWLSPLQRHLTTRLARLSDQWLTSLERYAGVVRKMRGDGDSTANNLAVFSSIGEPQDTMPLKERQRRLVVFGTRGRRVEVYRRSARELNRICEALEINEVIDIGRSIEFDISSVIDVPVVIGGEMTNADVSTVMAESIAGVIDYSAPFLAKSTIFASYCSHRMIPILANYGDSIPADGLMENVHYWRSDVELQGVRVETGQLIADHALQWYRAHNLEAHAKILSELLSSRTVLNPQDARLEQAAV